MTDLFKNLGFTKHPFSKYSAEEETEYLEKIFIPPRFYEAIKNDLEDGGSRFIIGDRGSGKSALMFKLIKELKNDNFLPVLIENYSSTPLTKNKQQFLSKFIQFLILDVCLAISLKSKILRILNRTEKEILIHFICEFYPALSSYEFENRVDAIIGYKKWNKIKSIYNKVLNKPFNFILSGTVSVITDLISRSIGNNMIQNQTEFFKEYFTGFDLTKIDSFESDLLKKLDEEKLLRILHTLQNLILKMKFKGIIFFLDKIDEYADLEGKASKITEFLLDIGQDTSLLQIKNISFVFLTWSRIRSTLANKGIRFDKFKPYDVTWLPEDLTKILEQRLRTFSKNEK